jgi:AcrR family transcriptional regulator
MSRAGRPRVHIHLSRETIARAGLALIDRDGPEALSLRNLAVELGVGTTTLYGHVRSRDEIVTDIVGLLLGEVDTTARPKEPWDDVLRRVAHSLRDIVLRHPGAFTLIALAPVDDSPVLDYARAIELLSCAGGMSEEQFIESWQVVDPFLTGFLLMETAALERGRQTAREGSGSPSTSGAFRQGMAKAHSDEAFAAALEIIIAGLREKQARDA